MAAAGVPMRTLREWMGHRDYQTTLRYADYAPSLHEAALVEAAFAPRGINRASNGAKPSEPTRPIGSIEPYRHQADPSGPVRAQYRP